MARKCRSPSPGLLERVINCEKETIFCETVMILSQLFYLCPMVLQVFHYPLRVLEIKKMFFFFRRPKRIWWWSQADCRSERYRRNLGNLSPVLLVYWKWIFRSSNVEKILLCRARENNNYNYGCNLGLIWRIAGTNKRQLWCGRKAAYYSGLRLVQTALDWIMAGKE